MRLAELRDSQATPTLRAIVPQYLPQAPLDPFSGKQYLWSSAQERFYSVGPDEDDNGLSVRYDPANGVFSSGDIALP